MTTPLERRQIQCAEYMRLTLTDPQRITADCVRAILNLGLDFDTIAFRGMSGALIAPRVAEALEKGVLMVRKNDGSHSYRQVEGHIDTYRYLILDDLISTGATCRAIIKSVKRYVAHPAVCVGAYLYDPENTEAFISGDDLLTREFSY